MHEINIYIYIFKFNIPEDEYFYIFCIFFFNFEIYILRKFSHPNFENCSTCKNKFK